jgi:hypothetical protein
MNFFAFLSWKFFTFPDPGDAGGGVEAGEAAA